MIAPVAVGLIATSACTELGVRHAGAIGVVATATLVAPVPALAGLFLVLASMRFRSAAARSRVERRERTACLEASELVALGLAGGLSVGAAHQVALVHAPPEACPVLAGLVEAIHGHGTRAALVADTGPMAEASQVLASAVASGAPGLPALTAYLDAESHRRHAEQVETSRKLPVRLLLPLTLLVLPGFVLMTVGPTVIESLARLNP